MKKLDTKSSGNLELETLETSDSIRSKYQILSDSITPSGDHRRSHEIPKTAKSLLRFTGAGRRDVVHDADVLGVSPRAEAKSMLVGVGPVSDSLRGEPAAQRPCVKLEETELNKNLMRILTYY
jgi:hypothetical protein